VKVAFVISGKSSFSMPGGLGAYAYNACQIVKELGYKVYMVGYSDKDEIIEMEFGTLIHVKTPFNFLASLGVVFITPYLVKRMRLILDDIDASQVLVFGAAIWGLAGPQLKKQMRNSQLPVTTLISYFTTYKHEYDGQVRGSPSHDYGLITSLFVKSINLFARLFFVPVEHKLLKEADRIVVHYDSAVDILLSEINSLDLKKIKKIPYYINIYDRTSDVSIVPTSSDKVRISIICRQDPRKGINSFLHAIKILKDKNIECVSTVAGTGFFFKNNKKLAKRLMVDDRVIFPGFIESVDEALDNTDIFVLPSVEEGSGAIAILEAMKKGVAIVTTRCDGMPEDFEHNKTGILVEMDNPLDLALALERLILDKKMRDELALNVRDDYPKRFSFDGMKDGMVGILADLADESKK